MTMPDTPGGPVEPTGPGGEAAGCAWWWWAITIFLVILILWWIFARTRPAYRTPSPTTPTAAMLLPAEPVVDSERMVQKAVAGFDAGAAHRRVAPNPRCDR